MIPLFQDKNILDYKAENFIEEIFFKISKRNILNDGSYGELENVSSWAHVEDLEKAWRCYGINRANLIADANYYIENKSFWCKELDWFYVNTLLFAELIATQKSFMSQILPLTKFVWFQTTPKLFSWKIFLWQVLCFVTRWGLESFICVKLFEFNSLLGCLYLSWIIFGIVYRKVQKRKMIKQMAAMVKTYLQVSSINFSWRVLRDEMDSSRKNHDVIWDQEVYKLIDLRLKNG